MSNHMENRESMEKADDLALVRGFKRGDEGAFNQLVRRHQQGIYQLCYRMVRNPDDAADLSQDVFVRAYLSVRKFREKSSFRTWIYRIAVNLCINHSRRRSGRKRAVLEHQTSNPEQELRRRRIGEAIDAAVRKLPPKQRAVFVMRQYEGMSYEDIAQATKRSVGTLKANYHHAIFKLRDLLKECKG